MAKPIDVDGELYYPLGYAAEFLGCTIPRVKKYIDSGSLEAYCKPGYTDPKNNRYFISRNQLIEFSRKLQQERELEQ